MGKAFRIVIHSVVSLIPSGGNIIFADFENRQSQFCKKMPEMSDLCYLGKTRLIWGFWKPVSHDTKVTELVKVFLTSQGSKQRDLWLLKYFLARNAI